MWLKHKSFKAYILSWRNQFQIQSWAAHGVQQKLQIIKQNPEIWNKKVFGSLIQQKASLTQRIDRSDKSDSSLSEEEWLLRNRIKKQLLDIVYKEEISWTWLKPGHNNTSFFHKVANRRRARNFVFSLNIDGSMLEDMENKRRNWFLDLKSSIQKTLNFSMVWSGKAKLSLNNPLLGKTGIHNSWQQSCHFRPTKWKSTGPGWFPHVILTKNVWKP